MRRQIAGLPRALEPKVEDQWRQCLDAGHTLRDLLKVDIANIDAPHVPWLAKHLATAIQHTQGKHQPCLHLRNKSCDSVFHWTQNTILICPRFSGDAAGVGTIGRERQARRRLSSMHLGATSLGISANVRPARSGCVFGVVLAKLTATSGNSR